MKILVPIDGSDCSYRALDFAAEMGQRYEGELLVVHFTSSEGKSTDVILDRANERLEEHGVSADPEVVTTVKEADPRYGNKIGKDILTLADERDIDHIVMGHHGAGAIGRLVLGSAAQTVVQAAETPATIVP